MNNSRKNKQGEPAMTQPKGANELSDDVLEAATGGATYKIYDDQNFAYLAVSKDEFKRLVEQYNISTNADYVAGVTSIHPYYDPGSGNLVGYELCGEEWKLSKFAKFLNV